MECIFKLNAIGSNILNRPGPNASGDRYEVFDATKVMFDAVMYQVIPNNTGTGSDKHL